ncbi:hypothetical protein REC12_22935 [Desulfosporosinus sp. PR]|nr:hypothetical protein [Desulfosporosinus sp. PR]
MSIKMLGEDLIFLVSHSDKNVVYKEGKIIHVCSKDINNQDNLLALFKKWWRKESLVILSAEMGKLYPT